MLKENTTVAAGVQALEAVGTVTASDYELVFAPLVARVRRTGTRMRLLYEFGPGFDRITPGALWADARLGSNYVRLLDGCALLTDIDWVRILTRRIGVFMPCPVRVYGNDDRVGALAWLSSLPERPDVSRPDIVKAYAGGVAAALGSVGDLAIWKATGFGKRAP